MKAVKDYYYMVWKPFCSWMKMHWKWCTVFMVVCYSLIFGGTYLWLKSKEPVELEDLDTIE